MYEKHHKTSGVSAIIGGLIIIVILFTTIIPLMIFLQNSYALFLNESNSRRIFDTDRMSESLAVEVSQNVATGQLVLILSNYGPVNVRIVRVWAVDVAQQTSIPVGGPCLEGLSIVLLTGTSYTLHVQQCVGTVTTIIQFFVVTERGRVFSSNKVYLTGGRLYDIAFPHTLTVSIINMRKGKEYEVRITPVGDGRASPDKFTHKATASNENVTVAFGVLAGRYVVELYEDDRLVRNPQRIEVPETTAVVFSLERTIIRPTPLDVIIISPNRVKENSLFHVEIDIKLSPEALERVTITNVYVNNLRISHDLPQGQFEYSCEAYYGFVISPGERKTVIHCDFSVGSLGGERTITITVPEGTIIGIGESGAQYVNNRATRSIRVIGGGRN